MLLPEISVRKSLSKEFKRVKSLGINIAEVRLANKVKCRVSVNTRKKEFEAVLLTEWCEELRQYTPSVYPNECLRTADWKEVIMWLKSY